MKPFPTEASPVFDGGLAIQNIAYLKIKALKKKMMDEHRLLLLKKKEKSKVRDVLARCRSVTLNRFFATRRSKKKKKVVKNKRLKKRKLRPWIYGRNEDERYFDTSFGQDIIDSKKKRFHMFKFNPISRKSLDLNPHKFFFYKMKKDPIYNSFLLEKVISAFATHGRHAKVRKVFYRIFLTDKYDYNIRTLYAVIGDLRPAYINVPVRMANRYYYAPIKASPMRSTMRAIRFFKKAVLSNKHEKSLEEKILAELENTFEF
jgi:ribosomal protein S7